MYDFYVSIVLKSDDGHLLTAPQTSMYSIKENIIQ